MVESVNSNTNRSTNRNTSTNTNTENYVTMHNEWFITKEGQIPLIHKYGEKAFTLLFRLLQTKTYRNLYIVDHYHLQKWFNISKPNKTKELMQIINTFAKDKIIDLDKEYGFILNPVPKELIIFDINNNYTNKPYFKIYDYEAERIFTEYQGNEDKYKLFTLFGCLKSHYNEERRICYPSIEKIYEETKIIECTILKYIDILRDNLNLILYDNPNVRIFKDGTIKEANNIYTMNYEGNEEILEEKIRQYKKDLSNNKTVIELGNISKEKRSISMKIEHLNRKLRESQISVEDYELKKKPLRERHEILCRIQDEKREEM